MVASRDADGGRAQKSKREGAYFFLVAFFFVAFFTVFFGAGLAAFFAASRASWPSMGSDTVTILAHTCRDNPESLLGVDAPPKLITRTSTLNAQKKN